MGITILEALMSELEPYTTNQVMCKKALFDAGFDGEAETASYYSEDCKKTVAKAAVNVLKKFLALSSEGLGKSSQSYNVEGLKMRIKSLCATAGLDADDVLEISSITDGSQLW